MAEALNAAIELHDSVVESFVRIGRDVQVTLGPAYIHKSFGTPGVDAGSEFIQDVILDFSDAKIDGEVGHLPADILDGDLIVENQMFPNMIDLPCELIGEISLSLHLSPDYRRISITAHGLKAKLQGEPSYLEEFHP